MSLPKAVAQKWLDRFNGTTSVEERKKISAALQDQTGHYFGAPMALLLAAKNHWNVDSDQISDGHGWIYPKN